MANPKIAFLASSGKQAVTAKNSLEKIYESTHVDNADVIIVLGGDGMMLNTLRQYISRPVKVFGMNRGTIGFLMNEFSKDNLLDRINLATLVTLHPLRMRVEKNNGEIEEAIAINEVSLIRQTSQTAKIKITIDNTVRMKELLCDGILVSTPAGSTAYNLSVHGPILSLHSKKLSISPISAFRPRRWKGKIVNDKLKITITNLNPSKRPISAVADNIEVRNAKNVTVKTNQRIKFNLLYDKSKSLQKKIKLEQLRRETS